jgi:hypothetical protein
MNMSKDKRKKAFRMNTWKKAAKAERDAAAKREKRRLARMASAASAEEPLVVDLRYAAVG